MLKILVTGGCGFVGSNFIRHLLDSNPRIAIINLDRGVDTATPSRLADLAGDERLQSVAGDITDRNLVRRIVATGVTAIVNCAETEGAAETDSASACGRTNVAGTQVLLDCARDFRVPRFLQVSTGAVYGQAPTAGPVNEETPIQPRTAYAASKAAADRLACEYAQSYGLATVVVRSGSSFGPYQAADRPLPRFILQVLRQEPTAVPGGSGFGDWLHIADFCAALDRLWRHGRTGQIYHVSGRSPRNGWDVAEAVFAAVGRSRFPLPHDAAEPLHEPTGPLDDRKIERELGWKPLIPFDRGLRHTVHWYRTHSEWVQPERPFRLAS
jgi:dTDP-glucose 4,6-dehydratase